jgi:hypothetical protein
MSANEVPGVSANAEKIWYHPSTEIALEVQHASRIRMIKAGKKKPFPILPVYQEDLKTDSDALLWGKLGDGMTLYFDFLKLMCWVFAATTLFSIPQLVLSGMGGTYVDSDGVVLSSPPVNAKLAKLTIGNLFFNDSLWVGTDELNQMRNVTIGSDMYAMTPRKVGLVLTLLDVSGIIVFLVALTWFNKKIDKKADRVGKNAYNMQQYSVVVKGLPRQAKEDEIRKFFSVFGPIADVKIASYSADFLTYLQEKSQIEEELVDLLSSGFKEIQQERDNAEVDGCCSKAHKPGDGEVGEHIPKIAIANNTIYTRRAKHIPMLHRMGELERQLVKYAHSPSLPAMKFCNILRMYANTQEDDKTDCYACFITFEKIADREKCLKMHVLPFLQCIVVTLCAPPPLHFCNILLMYDDSLYARLARGNRTPEEIESITFKCSATVEQSTKKTCSKAPPSGSIAVQPRVYAAQAPTNIMWQNLEYALPHPLPALWNLAASRPALQLL